MMDMIRDRRRFLLAAGLALAPALLSPGCGSGSSGAQAPVSPEMEKATAEMLKNKSHDYAERYRKKGGRR